LWGGIAVVGQLCCGVSLEGMLYSGNQYVSKCRCE
jgi:hypothetical protein